MDLSGVFSDRRIPIRMNVRLFETLLRLAMRCMFWEL